MRACKKRPGFQLGFCERGALLELIWLQASELKQRPNLLEVAQSNLENEKVDAEKKCQEDAAFVSCRQFGEFSESKNRDHPLY
jgi:hypothetical protein